MSEVTRSRLQTAIAWLRADRWRIVGALVLVMLATLFLLEAIGSDEPDPVGGPPMMRRLTEAQYRTTIADVFSPDIPILGRFEKPVRGQGLIAIGTSSSGMSPFAIEQYDAAAQGIAAAVMDPKQRGKYLDCQPKSVRIFDEKCARSFLTGTGRLLFRRPLGQATETKYLELARQAHDALGNFHQGLEMSLYAMLVSPEFLFRIERIEPGSDEGGVAQLDAYSKASRLSFFLTGSTPDDELLKAAERGDLDGSWGLSRQVDRLIKSDRFEGAVRDFFADMLEFELLNDLSKDPEIFPAFNSEVAADAKEQTLRTITHHLLEEEGDYRDLFTTRETFLTRPLGVIYRTPVATRGNWEQMTFAKNANRAGIQSHISFLALHSHPGRSSPTLRGYAARQVFLCQDVPDPPVTVDFAAVEENTAQPMTTARDRLKIHSTEPSCAGCHNVMDPLGLTMERYDGIGTFRTFENEARIDPSGSLDGKEFDTTDGLAKALRNHPETPRCVAERIYKSAVGRDITWGERYYLDWLIDGFADEGYRIPGLMRKIALSENFFTVTQPNKRPAKAANIAQSTDSDGEAL